MRGSKKILISSLVLVVFTLVVLDATAERKRRSRRHSKDGEESTQVEKQEADSGGADVSKDEGGYEKSKAEVKSGEGEAENGSAEVDSDQPQQTVQQSEESKAAETSKDRVKLSWGERVEKVVLTGSGTEQAPKEEEEEGKKPIAEFRKRQEGRTAWFRLILPQFYFLGAVDKLFVLGTEQGFQIEIAGNHVISALGEWGTGDSFMAGGGVGYSYELVLVRDIVRVELGGTAGFHYFEGVWEGDYNDGSRVDGFIILMLRPMIHIGYRNIFFSAGPKLGIGTGLIAGMGLGLMLRF